MKYLLFVLMITLAGHAVAENPWAQRFAADKAAAAIEQTVPVEAVNPLPAELPAPGVEMASATNAPTTAAPLHQRIDKVEIESHIGRLLEKEGAGETVEATLAMAPAQALLKLSAETRYRLSDIDYNAQELSWKATLHPQKDGKALPPIPLLGNYDEVMEVPVLTRRFRRDEVITEQDITWEKISTSRLRHDTAMRVEEMIGMSPQRTISGGRSIRLAELTKPKIVKKSDRVTLQYTAGKLSLKTLGEALEDGALGDTIRIRNQDSHQPVHARVIAPGLAEAMPFGVLASRQWQEGK